MGGGSWVEHFLAPVFAHADEALHLEAHASHALEYGLMAFSVLIALAGIGWAYSWNVKSPDKAEAVRTRFAGIYNLLLNKYWVDELYDKIVVNPLLKVSTAVYRYFDLAVVDGAANGLAAAMQSASASGAKSSTGRFRWGIVTFVLGCVFAIGWAFWVYLQGMVGA